MPPRLRLTRREALLGGLTAAGGVLLHRLLARTAADLRQPAAHGRRADLRRASHAAVGTRRWCASTAAATSRPSPPSAPPTPATRRCRRSTPRSGRRTRSCAAAGSPTGGWRSRDRSRVRARTRSPTCRRMPARTQITRHMCEEGWSAIAEWTGVPLGHVLQAAGILPSARYVTFQTFDYWTDNIDMLDALHPQTILAYGMNGGDLPVPHGGPVRLRVETQVGYKSLKFLRRLARPRRVRRPRQGRLDEERLELVRRNLDRIQRSAVQNAAQLDATPAVEVEGRTAEVRRPKSKVHRHLRRHVGVDLQVDAQVRIGPPIGPLGIGPYHTHHAHRNCLFVSLLTLLVSSTASAETACGRRARGDHAVHVHDDVRVRQPEVRTGQRDA